MNDPTLLVLVLGVGAIPLVVFSLLLLFLSRHDDTHGVIVWREKEEKKHE